MSAEVPRKRPDVVTIIAIYHFVAGGLALLGAGATLIFLMLPMTLGRGNWIGSGLGLVVLGFGVLATLAFGLAAIVMGWGLLELHSWARWGAVVLAILQLLAFPIGTVIGALIIWYLLTDQGREVFEGPPPPATT